jgi:hypothetical protein
MTRPIRKSMTTLLVLLGVLTFVALLVHLSMKQTAVHYYVCVNFNGNSHCASAAGSTAEEAIHAAHDIDCSQLAGNRNEVMNCMSTPPSQVQRLNQNTPQP